MSGSDDSCNRSCRTTNRCVNHADSCTGGPKSQSCLSPAAYRTLQDGAARGPAHPASQPPRTHGGTGGQRVPGPMQVAKQRPASPSTEAMQSCWWTHSCQDCFGLRRFEYQQLLPPALHSSLLRQPHGRAATSMLNCCNIHIRWLTRPPLLRHHTWRCFYNVGPFTCSNCAGRGCWTWAPSRTTHLSAV